MNWTAHESAIVEAGAEIGDDTRICHHRHVRSGATIGGGTSLGKNVYVDAGVTIGDRVKIQNNVSVYHGATIADDGVGAGVYHRRAVYDYECYRTHPRVHIDGGSRVAERVAGEVISLPVHQHLTEGQRDQVVSSVIAAVGAA